MKMKVCHKLALVGSIPISKGYGASVTMVMSKWRTLTQVTPFT